LRSETSASEGIKSGSDIGTDCGAGVVLREKKAIELLDFLDCNVTHRLSTAADRIRRDPVQIPPYRADRDGDALMSATTRIWFIGFSALGTAAAVLAAGVVWLALTQPLTLAQLVGRFQ